MSKNRKILIMSIIFGTLISTFKVCVSAEMKEKKCEKPQLEINNSINLEQNHENGTSSHIKNKMEEIHAKILLEKINDNLKKIESNYKTADSETMEKYKERLRVYTNNLKRIKEFEKENNTNKFDVEIEKTAKRIENISNLLVKEFHMRKLLEIINNNLKKIESNYKTTDLKTIEKYNEKLRVYTNNLKRIKEFEKENNINKFDVEIEETAKRIENAKNLLKNIK